MNKPTTHFEQNISFKRQPNPLHQDAIYNPFGLTYSVSARSAEARAARAENGGAPELPRNGARREPLARHDYGYPPVKGPVGNNANDVHRYPINRGTPAFAPARPFMTLQELWARDGIGTNESIVPNGYNARRVVAIG